MIVKHRAGEGVPAAVEAALGEINMAPSRLDGAAAPGATHAHAARPPRPTQLPAASSTRARLALGIAGCAAIGAEVVAWTSSERSPAVIALSVVSLLAGGPKTLRKAIAAARTFTLNINLLMLLAVVGALAIQEWPEAAMVTFLFACAEMIEARSIDRARDAIRSLMVLAPDTTHVRRDDRWIETETSEVQPGETIRVRPGERLPLDGEVSAGSTSIDQAPITGESIPIERQVGDKVFAGSVNQQGMIEVRVTAGAGDTTLAHIARTIREAHADRAPTERFVDRFARWYTPAVVFLALGVAAVPALLFHEPFQPWLYKALVLLVIACPCALVISTPVTIVSGLAAAAKHGLLVKGGTYLEQARLLRVIAVDKTGTVTHGKPALTDLKALAGLSPEQVLARAAAVEASSTHPLARAVTSGFSGEVADASEVRVTAGKGITARVDGEWIGVGSHRFAHELGVCTPAVEAELAALERSGKSTMVVWRGEAPGEAIGVIGVADTVRQTSIEAVAHLKRLGLKVVMLTGDHRATAMAVAAQLGVDDVAADLLPDDKVARIAELRASANVAMVGDGVNDAPALARASIGFAMGAAGSDTALETADVALMSDDLRGVPALIELSQRTATTLWTNISVAIGLKLVFFALALAGIATLWMAVFADMGASLLVAGNGLRLLRVRGRA